MYVSSLFFTHDFLSFSTYTLHIYFPWFHGIASRIQLTVRDQFSRCDVNFWDFGKSSWIDDGNMIRHINKADWCFAKVIFRRNISVAREWKRRKKAATTPSNIISEPNEKKFQSLENRSRNMNNKHFCTQK